MMKKLIKICSDFISHIIINLSDYMLAIGIILLLRYVYVIKGFDMFTLCLGFVFIIFAFIIAYNKTKK